MNANKIYSLIYNKEKVERFGHSASDYQLLKNRSLKNSGAVMYSSHAPTAVRNTSESMGNFERESNSVPIVRSYTGISKSRNSFHKENLFNMMRNDNREKYYEDKSI